MTSPEKSGSCVVCHDDTREVTVIDFMDEYHHGVQIRLCAWHVKKLINELNWKLGV